MHHDRFCDSDTFSPCPMEAQLRENIRSMNKQMQSTGNCNGRGRTECYKHTQEDCLSLESLVTSNRNPLRVAKIGNLTYVQR